MYIIHERIVTKYYFQNLSRRLENPTIFQWYLFTSFMKGNHQDKLIYTFFVQELVSATKLWFFNDLSSHHLRIITKYLIEKLHEDIWSNEKFLLWLSFTLYSNNSHEGWIQKLYPAVCKLKTFQKHHCLHSSWIITTTDKFNNFIVMLVKWKDFPVIYIHIIDEQL